MLRSALQTSQGELSIADREGDGAPLVLIHGNSASMDVFRRQFDSPLLQSRRMIALDLPGHGGSADAADSHAYTLPGYAAVVTEALEKLGVERPVLLGWSLGGHIAMEMMASGAELSGLVITGAPPIQPGLLGMLRGMRPEFELFLAGRGRLSERETRRFAEICLGPCVDAAALAHIQRTDARARTTLSRSMMRGVGEDERWAVEHLDIPLAVINGSGEPFARLDYLEHIRYAHLWEGRSHMLPGLGHAPFLEGPEAYNALLARFLTYADAYAASPPKAQVAVA